MKGPFCTNQPESFCSNCTLSTNLMCRYDRRDTLHFFMLILPFFVVSIGGMVTAGYGWWLFGWLAYMLFFFFVWEARVLCSHCPYWAEDSRILHCHANFGVIKIWRFSPEPMSKSEGIQFIIGALIFIFYPLIFCIMGGQYLVAGIGFASAISFGYLFYRNICSRCVNFSCPLNNVPHEMLKAYQERNVDRGY